MDNLVRAIESSFQRRKLGPFQKSYPAPHPIPDTSKKWPESTGIGGRFEPEQVSGLKRNHCPLSAGIYRNSTILRPGVSLGDFGVVPAPPPTYSPFTDCIAQ
jgi:hypothetical protein